MDRQEQSIFIARPPAEVFAYVDDIEREPEWQPNLREVEQTPPGPTKVGTRKRYVSDFLGKRVENTYEVVALEPGRRIAYETTRDSSVDVTSEVVCAPEDGGTRLTLTAEGRPRGMLRFVPSAVMEKAYRDELTAALERVKARLEG